MNGISNINSNSNVNFRAKMDVSDVAKNKRHWKQIAKLFEQKTAKYPNDVISLWTASNKKDIRFYNNSIAEFEGTLYEDDLKKLFEMKDSVIVSKFKKMFDIAHHREKLVNETNKYIEKMKKITKKELGYENEDAIWDVFTEISIRETDAMKNKDSFLKSIDVYF